MFSISKESALAAASTCLFVLLWSSGVYGFIMWLPSIIKQAAAADIVTVGWLSSVPYVASVRAGVEGSGRPLAGNGPASVKRTL